jgi:hypothetical protein
VGRTGLVGSWSARRRRCRPQRGSLKRHSVQRGGDHDRSSQRNR